MPAPVWFDGQYCDVCPHPDGFVFAYTTDGNEKVVVLLNGTDLLWERTVVGGNLLWLRIACDQATGEVKCIAVDGVLDDAILIEETGVTNLGAGVLQRATVLKHEGGDFVAYITRSNFLYTRWPLAGADPGAIPNPFTSSGSTQGIIDIIASVVRWANIDIGGGVAGDLYSEAPGGVFLRVPTIQGGVTVGQSRGNGAHPDAMYAVHDGIITRVIPTLCHEPYVTKFGDGTEQWAMCSRTQETAGNSAALVVAPSWVGATVGFGGALAGGTTHRSPRRTGRPLVPHAGGNRHGVSFTDPAGRLTSLPFRRGGTGVLSEGGPTWVPPDDFVQVLLDAISAVHGSILYRDAAAWAALAPGVAGQVLQTNGAGADPSWAAGGGGPDAGYWSELTDGDLSTAELIFASGDTIDVWVPTP